jgi:hypothetical protein
MRSVRSNVPSAVFPKKTECVFRSSFVACLACDDATIMLGTLHTGPNGRLSSYISLSLFVIDDKGSLARVLHVCISFHHGPGRAQT